MKTIFSLLTITTAVAIGLSNSAIAMLNYDATKQHSFSCEDLNYWGLAEHSPDCWEQYVRAAVVFPEGWEEIGTSMDGSVAWVETDSRQAYGTAGQYSIHGRVVLRMEDSLGIQAYDQTLIGDCQYQRLYATNLIPLDAQGRDWTIVRGLEDIQDDQLRGLSGDWATADLFEALGNRDRVIEMPLNPGTIAEAFYVRACPTGQ